MEASWGDMGRRKGSSSPPAYPPPGPLERRGLEAIGECLQGYNTTAAVFLLLLYVTFSQRLLNI